MTMHSTSAPAPAARGPMGGRGRGPMGGGPMAMIRGEKPRDFKGTMKKLIQYLGAYKVSILVVMVFAIAYWTNTWGDPYLERRDQGGGGWSSAYASTKVSSNRDSYLEVYGGKYLVYAPDDKQQFPSGFGADKKLFTDDDPIMNIPAGWSVIDLDKTPFAIDRSEKPTIDLFEGESSKMEHEKPAG